MPGANGNSDGVHRKQNAKKDQDPGRRQMMKHLLRATYPIIDLERQCGKRVAWPFRDEGYIGECADHEKGRRFADRPRYREDHTRHDARQGSGQYMRADRLPPSGTKRKCSVAERLGYGQ